MSSTFEESLLGYLDHYEIKFDNTNETHIYNVTTGDVSSYLLSHTGQLPNVATKMSITTISAVNGQLPKVLVVDFVAIQVLEQPLTTTVPAYVSKQVLQTYNILPLVDLADYLGKNIIC